MITYAITGDCFTGKKTHRYIIKKDDAEIFKRKLETDPTMGDTLKGHFGNQGKATNSKPRLVDDTEETSKAFKEYLIRLWRDEPDALPARRAAQLIGYRPPKNLYAVWSRRAVFSKGFGEKLLQ